MFRAAPSTAAAVLALEGASRGLPCPRTAVLSIDLAQPELDVAAALAPRGMGVHSGGLGELVHVKIRLHVAEPRRSVSGGSPSS